jgi:hypothetical protein
MTEGYGDAMLVVGILVAAATGASALIVLIRQRRR